MLLQLPHAFGTAAHNMAVDATLLETIPKDAALFRHYGWTEPSITFGYTQNLSKLLPSVDPDCQLCRRMTGGGLVDHRNDWTYALIFGQQVRSGQASANELYQSLHGCIRSALSELAIATHSAPCPRSCSGASEAAPAKRSSHCFTAPVQHDVLSSDHAKLAGAAIKKTRHGLLIQGSIDQAQLAQDFNYHAFVTRLLQHLAIQFQLKQTPLDDFRPLLPASRIAALQQQFSSDAWTQKR